MTASSVLNPVRPGNGQLIVRSELWTATPGGDLVDDISEAMVGADVRFSWANDVAGTLDATVRGRDATEAITDCLVPILDVQWRDSQGRFQRARQRLGLFFYLPPERGYSRTLELRRVRGQDTTWALGQLSLGKNYIIKKDSYLYGSWARDMYLSAGRTELPTNFPSTDLRPWKTLTYLPNTSTKEAMDDLYGRAGYWPVTARPATGTLTTTPRTLVYEQEPSRVVHSRDGDVVASDIRLVPDAAGFFNRIVLSSNNPQDELEMRDGYQATLVDPDSPYSAPNLGYVVSRELQDNRDDTFTVMRRRALSLLERGTSLQTRLMLAVLPDPRIEPRDVWEMEVRMDTGTTIGRGLWRVEDVTYRLGQGSAAMVCVVSKLSDVRLVS